tara:strand:+ start:137 stop:517 length:381 start_codon:yes stop_codon:yes gene_type:complete
MIGEVKIYNAKGKLKKTISQKKAVKLYNDNNKKDWQLSDREKKFWKSYKIDLPKKKHGNGRRVWLKRFYRKRKAVYECICIICKKKKILKSPGGKFCGEYCRGVERRRRSKELYETSRLGFRLPKR